jgi:hypothetical protein
MTRAIGETYENWNLDTVQQRTTELADVALNIWSL